MLESRRGWLICGAAALGLAAAKPLLSHAQAQGRAEPKPVPYPNGRDPNKDPQLDEPTRVDPRAIALANQKKLRASVSKLYGMVSELKEEVEKTDEHSVLSISLVRKAQEIEKLAKQIKNLARDSS